MLYQADLHLHTVLSPCGDLEMDPVSVINIAGKRGIDILGVTDHNTTQHCKIMKQLGIEQGIFVMMGVEVTTREEIHVLAFFENEKTLNIFQTHIDRTLPAIPNNPELFGYQVVVDRNGMILREEPHLLISALTLSIDDVEQLVHQLGGLFIPAHIDKPKNSITSQLGFLPPDLIVDALEISPRGDLTLFKKQYPGKTFITGSDAHYPEDIGRVTTQFHIEHRTFQEIRDALSTPGSVVI